MNRDNFMKFHWRPALESNPSGSNDSAAEPPGGQNQIYINAPLTFRINFPKRCDGTKIMSASFSQLIFSTNVKRDASLTHIYISIRSFFFFQVDTGPQTPDLSLGHKVARSTMFFCFFWQHFIFLEVYTLIR